MRVPVSLFSSIALTVALVWPMGAGAQAPKVLEVIAAKDATFKVVGQKKAVITLKAGQVIKIRVIGEKGPEFDKNGSVHSFTVNDLKDQGWDLQVKEGVNEFTLVAPSPGEYEIICAVKCGQGHDDMKMKLVVTP